MITADDDERFMREALALAEHAATLGEVPVGAVIVHFPSDGTPRIIGRGYNRRETDHDPTAHAEVVAMRDACAMLGSWRLTDCTLYVTLEPCPMCAGAMVQGRVTRVVYGCRDPKAGAIDSLFSICTDVRLNHRMEVVSGVLAEETSSVLKAFFRARREGARYIPPSTSHADHP